MGKTYAEVVVSCSQAESLVKCKRGKTSLNYCVVCLEEIVDGKH